MNIIIRGTKWWRKSVLKLITLSLGLLTSSHVMVHGAPKWTNIQDGEVWCTNILDEPTTTSIEEVKSVIASISNIHTKITALWVFYKYSSDNLELSLYCFSQLMEILTKEKAGTPFSINYITLRSVWEYYQATKDRDALILMAGLARVVTEEGAREIKGRLWAEMKRFGLGLCIPES
jgi:hypothetical protein